MSSSSPSIIKKKKSLSQLLSMTTATSQYLSAIHEADTRARSHENSFVAPSPTISLSSSFTASSEDTLLNEDDENNSLAYPLKPPTEQLLTTVHTEFGHCANEAYRCVSKHDYSKPFQEHTIEEPPYYILLTTYISLFILHCFGHMRDFFGKRFAKSHFTHLMPHDVRVIFFPPQSCSSRCDDFVSCPGLRAFELGF